MGIAPRDEGTEDVATSEAHRAFRIALLETIGEHEDVLPLDELMAIAAVTVGELVAILSSGGIPIGVAEACATDNLKRGIRQCTINLLLTEPPAGQAKEG